MLEKIEVDNYQAIKHIDLALGKFTVVVGPSGHGKSSLLRALRALCFNQTGERFIRHGQQKARVALTLDGGQEVVWEKPRGKSAAYTCGDLEYTRTGNKVPEDIENVLGIRRIEIDKGMSFTPQFHLQHDLPMLLTESSTHAARALAKLTKLSVLVEAQMDCRRDLKRTQRDHTAAEADAERQKAKMDELPNVRRVRNVLDRANKVMRAANSKLDTAKQADNIVQDIAGSLLIADLTLPQLKEAEALAARVDVLNDIVNAVIDVGDRLDVEESAAREIKEAEAALVGVEDQYAALVKELGACPLCGSTETWGHEH